MCEDMITFEKSMLIENCDYKLRLVGKVVILIIFNLL